MTLTWYNRLHFRILWQIHLDNDGTICAKQGGNKKKHVSAYRDYSFEDKAFLDICHIFPNAQVTDLKQYGTQ